MNKMTLVEFLQIPIRFECNPIKNYMVRVDREVEIGFNTVIIIEKECFSIESVKIID